MAHASGASEAKVALVEGYKTSAWILYNIINESRMLENHMRRVHSIEVDERGYIQRADLKHVEIDEKQAAQLMRASIAISGKLLLNVLEFMRRLKNVELEKLKLEEFLRRQGIPKNLSDFMSEEERKELMDFEANLKRAADVLASLFADLRSAKV